MSKTLVQTSKTIRFGNIQAVFTQIQDNSYEVILEISSHKFLIHMTNEEGDIQSFEIVAAKGFLELSMQSLHLLKTITYYLRLQKL